MIEPIKHNPNLDGYEGRWVATNTEGVVVASDKTSRGIAVAVLSLGVSREVLIQFVPPAATSYEVWSCAVTM